MSQYSVLSEARQHAEAQRYMLALDTLEQGIAALAARIDAAGGISPGAAVESTGDITDGNSFKSYLRSSQAGSPADPAADARELIRLYAAAVELCMLTLGRGADAARLIREAVVTAESFPAPFNESLMSGDDFFRMMWYYYVLPDRDMALRNIYRISNRISDNYGIRYRAQEIAEASDWDAERSRYINFYVLFPDQKTEIVTEHTLLPIPWSQESYITAVCDSVMASLEKGTHNKKNDAHWMGTLIYMLEYVRDLLKQIPTDKLDNEERRKQTDRILEPLSRHIAFQQADGFKTSYRNPAKLFLSRLSGSITDDMESVKRIREAMAGAPAPVSAPAAALAAFRASGTETPAPSAAEINGDGYFLSTAFTDRRVFLSSSFRDMIAERDYLLNCTFPDVDMYLRQFGFRLTPVDLRGIKMDGSEDGYNRECFTYCMKEIDRSDLMIGLIGDRYGSVLYDENMGKWDPAMKAIVAKTAREHGVSVDSLSGKSITHIEMMYGLKALGASRCYFYVKQIRFTDGADESDLQREGFDDGEKLLSAQRLEMVRETYGISRIAPENEPGGNLQYYSASFDGKRFSNLETLGKNIRTKLYHDCVYGGRTERREVWHTRVLSFWSDAAHQTIPHPRLDELLEMKDRFILLTGPEGIGKTVLLAQYWERMRQKALVIPVEAFLEPECGTINGMLDRVEPLSKALRKDLPAELMLTKNVIVIVDGIDRLVGRGMCLNISEDIQNRFRENVRVILCATEKFIKVPGFFRVMKLTEPPAPAKDLVRNVAFRSGKRLDEETISVMAELAGTGGNNPLYTELITRRLLYQLQDEYTKDMSGRMQEMFSSLDGSIESAGRLIADRAALAADSEEDRRLARAVWEEVRESEKGSLAMSELFSLLTDAGHIPPCPPNTFSNRNLNAFLEEQRARIVRVVSMLRPLLLFDHSAHTISLGHVSLTGGKTRADAQKEILARAAAADALEEKQKSDVTFPVSAVIAACLGASLFPWPYDPGMNVRTLLQVLAAALSFTPVSMVRDEVRKKRGASLAGRLIRLLHGLSVIMMILLPIIVISGTDIPENLKPLAGGFSRAFMCLSMLALGLFCLLCFFMEKKRTGKAWLLVLPALAGIAASAAGLYLQFAGIVFPSVWQAAGALAAGAGFLFLWLVRK